MKPELSRLFLCTVIFVLASNFGDDTCAAQNPFTLGKETTAIEFPLRSDGVPDYLEALNERQSRGVTADNNAFVAILEASGPSEFVRPELQREFLKRCGAENAVFKHLPILAFDSYVEQHTHLTGKSLEDAENNFWVAEHRLWSSTQFPLLAKFLEEDAPLLEAATAASYRSRWYVPYVDGKRATVHGAGEMFPTARLGSAIRTLLVRATLEEDEGHFDKCLADILTVKRYAQLVSTGQTEYEQGFAGGLDRGSTEAAASIVATGRLTREQWEKMKDALGAFPPLPSTAAYFDIYQRWLTLDLLFVVRTHQEANVFPEDVEMITPMQRMTEAAISWNTVFKTVNREVDSLVEIVKETDNGIFLAAKNASDKRLEKFATLFFGPTGKEGMTRGDSETVKSYSERIGEYAVSKSNFTCMGIETLRRKWMLEREMLSVLFAAAEFRTDQGHWPQSAQELLPQYLKSLPLDFYSPNGRDPVRYLVSEKGPFVYAVSRNFGVGAAPN